MSQLLFDRIRFRGQPVANPASTITTANARFTFLTPHLVRLEWSETGQFEDRSTYAFPTREAPAVNVTTRMSGHTLVLDSGALEIRYTESEGPFRPDNLSIAFDLDGERRTWTPATPNPGNLRGTRRTLDECGADAGLDEGLLSRAGWALFDDSENVVYDDGWVAPRPDHALQDWYFFAYGHAYTTALADYTQFGGEIPLIPRYVLGAWWSRYWAYSAQDFKDLVHEFAARDLPLDVLVIDMDWHTPDGWTGYTWNRELFPDPPGFLKWVHDRGLRATLNLHPADGIHPHEEVYPQFAQAMGIDPASKQPVPFRIADKQFVQHYFELIHHPMEDDGVDFWWMDWQQGEISEVKGLDPLGWINHLHFEDSKRRGQRAMLYSRWGGLGNHRYHIGFSGDTWVLWEALQFQPYMTATASNVGYGWWSHDIGGHYGGATDPELYTRWVQFGALSPCLRLHSSKDARAERRPWAYPDDVYEAAKAAFHLRYQLVPYLYTMARVAVDTSVSLCRPMYYEHPAEDDAYAARYQYYFGDQMIAAPIVFPADPDTGMASNDVWVPPGMWIDFQTLETHTGPRWIRVVGDLDRIPALVRAGGILPLAPVSPTTGAIPQDHLIIAVYPGADGDLTTFRVYEDDGISEDYRQGKFEWTPVTNQVSGDTWTVTIEPVEGSCAALPDKRSYAIRLVGSRQPQTVTINKKATDNWTYDAESLTTVITVPKRGKSKRVMITAAAAGGIVALGDDHNRAVIRADLKRLLGDAVEAVSLDNPATILALDGVPGQRDAVARLGGPSARFISFTTPEEASQQLGRVIVGNPVGEPYDLSVTFTFTRGGETTQDTITVPAATDSHILDTPFAWDGTITPARWSAEARLTWRGESLTYTYQSAPMFPSIPAWRYLIVDRDEHPNMLDQIVVDPGALPSDLEWIPHIHTADQIRANLTETHNFVPFWEYEGQLKAGKRLIAYLVTTITSPDARECTLKLWAKGALDLYLNGQPLTVPPEPVEQTVSAPFFRPTRVITGVGLRAGANVMLMALQPRDNPRSAGYPFWGAGALIVAPDGTSMPDLMYE